MAERRRDVGGASALTVIAETNQRCLMEARHAGFAREHIDEVRENPLRRLAAVARLLDRTELLAWLDSQNRTARAVMSAPAITVSEDLSSVR